MTACSFDEPGREGVHPVVDGARVDRDPTLSEPFCCVGVAESESQVPADTERNDLIGKAVTTEADADRVVSRRLHWTHL